MSKPGQWRDSPEREATLAPFVQNILKTTTLSGQDWLLVLIVTVIGTFWIEISKVIFWRGTPQQ